MKLLSILSLILLFASNALALVASDVDMSQASADITVIVLAVLSLLTLMLGYKKVMSLLGR